MFRNIHTSIRFGLNWILVLLIALFIFGNSIVGFAQQPEPQDMTYDRATGIMKLNFVAKNLQEVLKWLSEQTGLTIIASEADIKDKNFALTNFSGTIDEALEQIKTILAQYDLTTIRTDKTLLITTMEKAIKMKVPVYVLENVADYEGKIEQTDQVITQIIMLKSAVAAELVNSIKPLAGKSANVFADANSNSLVITDVASNIYRIAAILKIVDSAPEESALKVKVIPLHNGEARSMAQTLNELFREETNVTNILRKMSYSRNPDEMREMLERAKQEGRGIDMVTGRVQIAADESSNALIIKASEHNIAIIENLVNQLDTSNFIQNEMKVFRLDYASAENVATELQDLIQGGMSSAGRMNRWDRRNMAERMWWQRQRMREQGQQIEQTGIIGEVNIASDSRLNAILVSSDARNFSFIEKIIKELDQPDPKEEMRIHFLKYANAAQLVQTLQDLFEGGSVGGQGWDSQWRRWDRRRERQEWGGQGFGVQGDVNLVADDRLNAILFSTAAQNLPTVEDLITQLDVSMPDQEWNTKIYPLKYADAENVAEILNNVYEGSSQGRGFGFFFFLPQRQRNYSRSSLSGNITAEAYPTLNAIIVSTATQRNFELVDEFIKEIDTPTPDDQREITQTIPLEYADADDLAQLLSQVWEGEGGQFFSFSRFFSRGGRAEQKDINSLRGKVTVFADPQTNSLIITTRKRYWEDVEALIKELDIVRGQVWLDMEILEITLDENTKLGLELSTRRDIWLKRFDLDKGVSDALKGAIIPELQLNQEISGFSYALMTKEYLALIHTLMKENKVRTLSTPSILTRDNEPAKFSKVKRIPYLESVETSYSQNIGGSQQQKQQGEQNFGEGNQGGSTTVMFGGQPLYNYGFLDDVGITVEITPHIAKTKAGADGKRTIGLDITNINAGNFIEFTDFNAPITENSNISAYIDVEDGQPILIGGMIKSKQQNIEYKVPFLGSVPLIGRLFKKTETAMEDSEIIMIITPHIVDIKSEEDKARLEQLRQERFGNTDEIMNDANNNRMKNGNNRAK
jgi:type II secretory pathway component GspD/PulD (secretin)